MIKKTSNTQRKGNESDSQEHSICLKERQYRFSLYSIAPGPVKHTGIRIDMRKKEEEGNREYPSQKARKFREFLKRKMTFSAYHSKVKEGAETQKSVKGKKILHLMPNRGKRKGNKENHQEKQVHKKKIISFGVLLE